MRVDSLVPENYNDDENDWDDGVDGRALQEFLLSEIFMKILFRSTIKRNNFLLFVLVLKHEIIERYSRLETQDW